MKISAVLQNTFKCNFATSRNVDLTSFGGENNRSQTTSMTDTKANEAIKNNGMSHVAFTGVTQNWWVRSHFNGGTSGYSHYMNLQDGDKTEEKSAYYGLHKDSSTLREMLYQHSLMHPNSSLEETSNRYETNRIYFADPEEVVNEQTKRDHDIIVYDNRPAYPTLSQVRENYFNIEADAQDHGAIFRNIGEYYYRLEMADKREYDKLVEERKRFQPEYDQSRSYKETIDARIENTPWNSQRANKDKEKADYYFSINHEKM